MESPKGKDFQQHSYTVDGFIQVLQLWEPHTKQTVSAVAGLQGWQRTQSVKKEVSAAETESGVKEESGRPQKKALKEKSVEAHV
uniref:Uncharacterized protein n=1 Tax=Brassica campestris TaxID=3711 RepID=A0A3P5Z730_BRACM|nr:unnamed protein product [Brassica rapa]